jgi:hypothetical protein
MLMVPAADVLRKLPSRQRASLATPTRLKGEVIAKPDSRQIAQVTDSTHRLHHSPQLSWPPPSSGNSATAPWLIKSRCAKPPPARTTRVSYFLVGMGLRGGMLPGHGPAPEYWRRRQYSTTCAPHAERYIHQRPWAAPPATSTSKTAASWAPPAARNSGGSRCDLKVDDQQLTLSHQRPSRNEKEHQMAAAAFPHGPGPAASPPISRRP